MIVVPVTTSYREVVRSGNSTLSPASAVETLPSILSDVAGPRMWANSIQASSASLFMRLRHIDSVAIVYQRTPSTVPYRSTLELAMAPAIGLIPRAVWPSKPVLATGYDFGRTYYGQSTTTYSSSAVTPMADLYRHGGWVVLLLGSLLLGSWCRALDRLVRIEQIHEWSSFSSRSSH